MSEKYIVDADDLEYLIDQNQVLGILEYWGLDDWEEYQSINWDDPFETGRPLAEPSEIARLTYERVQ